MPDDFEFISDLELLSKDELVYLILWDRAVEALDLG